LWVANGANPDIERMLDVVGNGAYCCLWEGNGELQARTIREHYPNAPILMRHHCPEWNTMDPSQWAYDVYKRMQGISGITRHVVGANEMNLEPNLDFTEARFAQACSWYKRFAISLRNWMPDAVIHFPAFAAGHGEDDGYCGLITREAREAIAECSYVNTRGYWSVETGPLTEVDYVGGGLRYRKVKRLLKSVGIEKPVWIDEAGPWANPNRVEQTAAHSEQVVKDGVICTYFLWYDPTNTPGNTFNQWYGNVDDGNLSWLKREWSNPMVKYTLGPFFTTHSAWVITRPFGYVCSDYKDGFHKGTDLARTGTTGTEGAILLSPFDGIVDFVWFREDRGWEIYIYDPKQGVEFCCYHMMTEPNLRSGDLVLKGQMIGYVGNTGALTSGPHAHVGLCAVLNKPGFPIDTTQGRLGWIDIYGLDVIREWEA